MRLLMDHVVTPREALPAVRTREVLPVRQEDRLVPFALPYPREEATPLPVVRLALPMVWSDRLLVLESQRVQVSELPTMAMSVTSVAGQRIPILEGTGHRLTVREIKRMASLSRFDRLMRVDRSGRATPLGDEDVVNLLDDCELQVVRRNLAS